MVAVFKMREKKGRLAEPIGKTLLDLRRNNTAAQTESFPLAGHRSTYILE